SPAAVEISSLARVRFSLISPPDTNCTAATFMFAFLRGFEGSYPQASSAHPRRGVYAGAMIIHMTILFNNHRENLVHGDLYSTTSSDLALHTLPVRQTQAAGSLTATALSRAVGSWSRAIAQSNGATSEQLRSVASRLTALRNENDGLAAQLGRIL